MTMISEALGAHIGIRYIRNIFLDEYIYKAIWPFLKTTVSVASILMRAHPLVDQEECPLIPHKHSLRDQQ